jgi:hypothetical protein
MDFSDGESLYRALIAGPAAPRWQTDSMTALAIDATPPGRGLVGRVAHAADGVEAVAPLVGVLAGQHLLKFLHVSYHARLQAGRLLLA